MLCRLIFEIAVEIALAVETVRSSPKRRCSSDKDVAPLLAQFNFATFNESPNRGSDRVIVQFGAEELRNQIIGWNRDAEIFRQNRVFRSPNLLLALPKTSNGHGISLNSNKCPLIQS